MATKASPIKTSTLKSVTKTLYPINLFNPDPENARGHDARNIRAIADSIKQFGQRIPILVDADLVIRKGNGTWLAMKLLERDKIWAIPLELEGPAKAAFAIADNRAAELAHWEWQIVKQTLQSLDDAGQDITELGFTDFELEPLLAASWQPPAIAGDGEQPQSDQNESVERIFLMTDTEFKLIVSAIREQRRKRKNSKQTEGGALSLICQEWMEADES